MEESKTWTTGRKSYVNVRIESALKTALGHVADREGMSLSDYLRKHYKALVEGAIITPEPATHPAPIPPRYPYLPSAYPSSTYPPYSAYPMPNPDIKICCFQLRACDSSCVAFRKGNDFCLRLTRGC